VDLAAANTIAMLFSFAIAITIGLWYLAPAARSRPLGSALILLLWFHAFRHIAMQIFSAADVGGLAASDTAQRTIAYGDLATAIVAFTAMWALHQRAAIGRHLAWLAAIIGTADLISAAAVGVDEKLTDTATDLSWFTLAFYVPILWVTGVMLLWQLWTRRSEPLFPAAAP
jgi:type III secretory pathway component EscS